MTINGKEYIVDTYNSYYPFLHEEVNWDFNNTPDYKSLSIKDRWYLCQFIHLGDESYALKPPLSHYERWLTNAIREGWNLEKIVKEYEFILGGRKAIYSYWERLYEFMKKQIEWEKWEGNVKSFIITGYNPNKN